jgi:hypothetical protein
MPELSRCPCLASHAIDRLRAGELSSQEFQRHLNVQCCRVRHPHHAHGPFSQFALQRVSSGDDVAPLPFAAMGRETFERHGGLVDICASAQGHAEQSQELPHVRSGFWLTPLHVAEQLWAPHATALRSQALSFCSQLMEQGPVLQLSLSFLQELSFEHATSHE